jgi:N-acetylglucosamine-6-phosphate deacetylase
VLAGSVLTLDRALRNFVAYTGASVAEALPLLTHNPAAMSGLAESAGAIRIGATADLVVVADDGGLVASIIGGRAQDATSAAK